MYILYIDVENKDFHLHNIFSLVFSHLSFLRFLFFGRMHNKEKPRKAKDPTQYFISIYKFPSLISSHFVVFVVVAVLFGRFRLYSAYGDSIFKLRIVFCMIYCEEDKFRAFPYTVLLM